MSSRSAVLIAALAAAVLAPALRANETFTVRLAPAPRDAAMRTTIAGSGTAEVTIAGHRLTIAGSFAGFTTPATRAELRQGPAVAIRGPGIHMLTVTPATSGSLSGSITLSPAELAAMNAGQLYVQIATESAPDGNVLGWLLPAAAPAVRDR